MKTSRGQKRKRKRDRRFRELWDTLSLRTATAASLAAFGFLVMQAARTFLAA